MGNSSLQDADTATVTTDATTPRLFSFLFQAHLISSMPRFIRTTIFALFLGLLLVGSAKTQDGPRPDRRIIDVHLHALPIDFFPAHVDTAAGYERPDNGQALIQQTVDRLERFGVTTAVTSGNAELLAEYKKAAPDRIMRSLWIPWDIKGDSLRTYLDSLGVWHEQGRFEVIGEVLTQYSGIAPSDSILDPLWAFAEREEVPVGIHINDRPATCPDSFTDGCTPRALEEVLAVHPGLKVYVMHGGYPRLEDMIDLLDAYPQVYVGATFNRPQSEGQLRYLKELVEAGYGDRVMFGSDQMLWPELIGDFVRAIEGAGFLTEEQKQDIFYENAARFFDLGNGTSGDS